MPFIGINPPTNRVGGLPGAASTIALASAPLQVIVDATALNTPGLVAWYKDPLFGKISVLAYAQAAASIAIGAALVKTAGFFATTVNSAGTVIGNGLDTGVVQTAGTASVYSGLSYNFAGVAAAPVSNTGAYFWRYISGYVPIAKCGSAIASGTPLAVAPSTAGVLGKPGALNATATNATVNFMVGFPLMITDNADGSTASIVLSGWYA